MANETGLTGARIQQIIVKELEKELLISLNIDSLNHEEKNLAKKAVKEEIKQILKVRKEAKLEKCYFTC